VSAVIVIAVPGEPRAREPHIDPGEHECEALDLAAPDA
jgi:hypothetical protein